MSDLNARVAYLFARYFDKSATAQEADELFKLLGIAPDDEQLNPLLKQAWESLQVEHAFFNADESEKMLSNILYNKDEIATAEIETTPVVELPTWRRYAAIAAVLFLTGVGLYFALKPAQVAKPAVAAKQHDVLPGGNKAILTLANGSTIVLDNANNGELARQGSSIVNKTQNGQLVYSDVKAQQQAANVEVAFNTVATPRGGQYQVVLPDGSKVWLNAESSIKYPTVFNGNDRVVEMTGEVYFEVAKNASKPFKVKSKRAEVEVLGTHFNVMAYDDEAEMKTTLLEGSVKITSGSSSKILRPLEQALVNANSRIIVTTDIDVEEEIAWKNGLFQFTNDDTQSIMRQVARWYDVDVIYQGKIPDKRYAGRISRNVKASVLMTMLRYTGLNSRIEGRTIFIMN